MKTQSMRLCVMGLLVMVASSDVWAWNLREMAINVVEYKQNGIIEFTLWNDDDEKENFVCDASESKPTWFRIEACDYGDVGCIAASNRLASALLGAKLAAKKVHVQRNNCVVTEVALRSN